MATGQSALQATEHQANRVSPVRRRKMDHVFFTTMAFVMAAGVFGGFARTYFAKTFFHTPQIPLWVHVHGAVFTAWILFYVLQNLLALSGGMKLHMRLGITGGVLATAVVIMGMAVTVRQVHHGNFFPFPDAYSLVAVSTVQMVFFAFLISLGLLWKRDAESHKRLMHMSSQLFFFPAFGRLLGGINGLTLGLALALFCAGPVYDRLTRGHVHRTYKWGVPLLILTTPPFSVIASHLGIWRFLVDKVVL